MVCPASPQHVGPSLHNCHFQQIRMEGMELVVVDYLLDPYSDQVIFPNPILKSIIVTSTPSCSLMALVVSQPRKEDNSLCISSLSINSPTLNYSPLSPSTHNLLSSCFSPLFDPTHPADLCFSQNPNPCPEPALEATTQS